MPPKHCASLPAASGFPVTTTLMGIGACDTTEALSLRMLGMHGAAFANYAVEDCDFLIAVGARFDDRVAALPEKFAPKARRVAHFDVDPAEIGKVKKVDWHHVGVLGPRPRSAARLRRAASPGSGFRGVAPASWRSSSAGTRTTTTAAARSSSRIT